MQRSSFFLPLFFYSFCHTLLLSRSAASVSLCCSTRKKKKELPKKEIHLFFFVPFRKKQHAAQRETKTLFFLGELAEVLQRVMRRSSNGGWKILFCFFVSISITSIYSASKTTATTTPKKKKERKIASNSWVCCGYFSHTCSFACVVIIIIGSFVSWTVPGISGCLLCRTGIWCLSVKRGRLHCLVRSIPPFP